MTIIDAGCNSCTHLVDLYPCGLERTHVHICPACLAGGPIRARHCQNEEEDLPSE